jgi:hypothetical protein
MGRSKPLSSCLQLLAVWIAAHLLLATCASALAQQPADSAEENGIDTEHAWTEEADDAEVRKVRQKRRLSFS